MKINNIPTSPATCRDLHKTCHISSISFSEKRMESLAQRLGLAGRGAGYLPPGGGGAGGYFPPSTSLLGGDSDEEGGDGDDFDLEMAKMDKSYQKFSLKDKQ